MEEKEMKEYKVITALFLSAVMLGTAPLTVWGAESFSTGESFSDGTENIPDIVTDSALSGESSERDYELSIETGTDVELTESDFYDPEFRVEKYVKVRNSGKKETRVRVDASGLKNFEVDDQMAKWSEDYEEKDGSHLAGSCGKSIRRPLLPVYVRRGTFAQLLSLGR